jgi:hypothetical protein
MSLGVNFARVDNEIVASVNTLADNIPTCALNPQVNPGECGIPVHGDRQYSSANPAN